MIEIEEILHIWKKDEGQQNKKYIHICRYQQILDEENNDSNQWLGKIRSLKAKITGVQSNILDNI
jgi:hypothetical protein